MKLPRSASGWTIAVFGVMALLFGVVTLTLPDVVLTMLGFEVPDQRAAGDYTRTFLAASAVSSLNMGVYYLVAAATNWRPFFFFTVPFRLLTFTVFTVLVVTQVAPAPFLGVAVWEALGALATGVALWAEPRSSGAFGAQTRPPTRATVGMAGTAG
jgi:hypothetical protein